MPAFFNKSLLFELAIVLPIIIYCFARYWRQTRALRALSASLQVERSTLLAAQSALVGRSDAAAQRLADLRGALKNNTLVERRFRAVEGGARRLPEPHLSREVVSATDEARFWTGAFTFIGLGGTLICLSIAVVYLMLIIQPAADGGRGMEEVVSHLISVFGGMGAAFACTAAGVCFTLLLGGQISQVERDWENLRAELDDFSLLEMEPLVAQVRNDEEDLTRLEKLMAHMESISAGFTQGLEASLFGVEKLQEVNAQISDEWRGAAQTLGGAVDGLSASADSLDGQLKKLTGVIESYDQSQGARQRAWDEGAGRALLSLHETLVGAQMAFEKLDALRSEFLTEGEALRAELLRRSDALRGEMLQQNEQSRGEMREVLRVVEQSAQNMGTTSQSTIFQLRDEINKGLLGVQDAIDKGVDSEERLLVEFAAILQKMGDYASHVEEVLHQLPMAIGGQPLLQIEPLHLESLAQLNAHVGQVRGEISGLRGDVREVLGDELKATLQASANGAGQQLKNLMDGMETLGRQVRQTGGAQGGDLKTMQEGLSALNADMRTLAAHVTQINDKVSRLDKSFVIRLGGRK